MSRLSVGTNCLGFELHDGDHLATLYRAAEAPLLPDAYPRWRRLQRNSRPKPGAEEGD